MSTETFPLHFEGCEHVLNIPLLHNPDLADVICVARNCVIVRSQENARGV